MNCSNHLNVNLNFSRGFPAQEFLEKAWASEPLTNILKQTNIPFALPTPDEDISFIAKYEQEVIG